MNTKTISQTHTSALQGFFTSPIQWAVRAFEVQAQRAQLAELDQCALRDLGLDSVDRDFEVNRHFWDF